MRAIAASALVIACFTASAQTIDERAAAAGWTATHDPLCATATSNSPMTPFYWEIGDEDATHARSGFAGIGAPGNGDPMAIASASKWVYAAYVAEKFGGSLSAYDIRFLTMPSGYVGMGENQCNPSVSTGPQTVDQCLAKATNGTYFPALDGYWIYNSGHFENHAVHAGTGGSGNVLDLGAYDENDLGLEFTSTLHHLFLFAQPLLAGGMVTTPAQYAAFLRDILGGDLQMAGMLGANKRCTNDVDGSCPTTKPPAINMNPVPDEIFWDYSLGHWVESNIDHPSASNGDGSFSSAGSRGFYPWIDAGTQWYGIIARSANRAGYDEGWNSYLCGAQIRLAWVAASSP
jgi:hypothetical protein